MSQGPFTYTSSALKVYALAGYQATVGRGPQKDALDESQRAKGLDDGMVEEPADTRWGRQVLPWVLFTQLLPLCCFYPIRRIFTWLLFVGFWLEIQASLCESLRRIFLAYFKSAKQCFFSLQHIVLLTLVPLLLSAFAQNVQPPRSASSCSHSREICCRDYASSPCHQF